jgi:hypothetical protein
MNTIKHFIEKPVDEFNNRMYTGKQPFVISAEYEKGKGLPGTFGSLGILHVIEPEFIKSKWPTLSELYWKEVDLPVGAIKEDEWLSIFE